MSPNSKAEFLGLVGFGIYTAQDVIVKYLGATCNPLQILFFSVLCKRLPNPTC